MLRFTSERRRLEAVARTVAVSLLLCLAFSWRLWLSTRLYPLVPALDLVPRFPWPLDAGVLALLVGLLAGLALRPLSRGLAATVVGLFVVLFAQDQSRLWPSFYLFVFLLLFLVGSRRDGDEAAAGRMLAGMRFAVAMASVWGGVLKLNHHFAHEEFPWFVKPLTDFLPGPVPGLPIVAVGAAAFETLFGLGLLTRRFRAIALGDALLMHAVVFVCIGPLRGDWNDGAWIWSQTMAVLLVLLFGAAPSFRFETMFAAAHAGGNLPAAAAVVFLGVLPVLNAVNRWDSAPSFNVYTGNVSRAHVILPADAAAALPAELAPHVAIHGEWAVFDPNAWSMRQFNAGVYPEERIFRAILAVICRQLPEPSARLVIEEKAGWFFPKTSRVLECGTE